MPLLPNDELGPLLDSFVDEKIDVQASASFSTIVLSQGRKIVDFVMRGRTCWEVRLANENGWIRLGPFFVLPETACVIVDGLDQIALVGRIWLEHTDLDRLLDEVTFFNMSGYPAGDALKRAVI